MEPPDVAVIPPGRLVLVDTAPIICTLEAHPRLASRCAPLFERHAADEIQLAVTTVTFAEVLTGPLGVGNEALAARYRATLTSWRVVAMDAAIAEQVARLRIVYCLKLPDAVQLASALAVNACALVTHDRDFAAVRELPVFD